VVRDFFAPKLPTLELSDKLRALKKRDLSLSFTKSQSPKEKYMQEKKVKTTHKQYLY